MQKRMNETILLSERMSDSKDYLHIAEETVRKIRRVERANREENLIDVPKSELLKAGIRPGDVVDVQADPARGGLHVTKLVPESPMAGATTPPEKTYNQFRRNAPRSDHSKNSD